MIDVLAGTGASLRFDLQGPTGTLLPDGGTTSYQLFGQDGSLLASASLSPTAASVTVPIDASRNTIDASRRFEKRTVRVLWASDGVTHSLRQTYRVVPFLNATVAPADVRIQLGLDEDELADSEIDILAAYLNLEAEVGRDVLEAALGSGDLREVAGNRAIAVQAALDLMGTTPIRALMAVTDGDQKAERFRSPPDFTVLAASLRDARAKAIRDLTGTTAAEVLPTLAVLITPVDVITGA